MVQERRRTVVRLHPAEAERIRSLRSYDAFDALTRLAALVCQTPVSTISLVDTDRQWSSSAYGTTASALRWSPPRSPSPATMTLDVVAEGVENDAVRRQLVDLGCSVGAGRGASADGT